MEFKDIFKMSDATYNRMKFIAQVFLPALGSLYFALSKIWGLPLGGEIVASFAALDTFLGAVLMISTKYYNEENEDGLHDGLH